MHTVTATSDAPLRASYRTQEVRLGNHLGSAGLVGADVFGTFTLGTPIQPMVTGAVRRAAMGEAVRYLQSSMSLAFAWASLRIAPKGYHPVVASRPLGVPGAEGADYSLPTDDELEDVQNTWEALTHGCKIVPASRGL